jgi:prepilin-type N-terminal cleavage/methylation domain-containing protein
MIHLRQHYAKQFGFTLIELMLVVSIIGILASIAMPAFKTYVTRAKIVEGLTLADPAQKAVAAYYDRWGRLPANNAAATLAAPNAYRGRYVDGIEVKEGVITIAFKDLTEELSSASLTMRPALNSLNPTGPLMWSCGDTNVAYGFELIGTVSTNALAADLLPKVCRP